MSDRLRIDNEERFELMMRPMRGLLAEQGWHALMRSLNRGPRTPYQIFLASEILARLEAESATGRSTPCASRASTRQSSGDVSPYTPA